MLPANARHRWSVGRRPVRLAGPPRARSWTAAATRIARHIVRARPRRGRPAARRAAGRCWTTAWRRCCCAWPRPCSASRTATSPSIDTWRTWPWGEAVEWGQTAAHRSRWLQPRILEIAPVPCGDAPPRRWRCRTPSRARPEGLHHDAGQPGWLRRAGRGAVGAPAGGRARCWWSPRGAPASGRSPKWPALFRTASSWAQS